MAKLKLNPDPTFKTKVGIPVPGVGKAPVEFTFKHRTADQLAKWGNEVREASDPETIMDCVVAWDLDDEFNAANVKLFCNNYPGAAYAIVTDYMAELRGARAKN